MFVWAENTIHNKLYIICLTFAWPLQRHCIATQLTTTLHGRWIISQIGPNEKQLKQVVDGIPTACHQQAACADTTGPDNLCCRTGNTTGHIQCSQIWDMSRHPHTAAGVQQMCVQQDGDASFNHLYTPHSQQHNHVYTIGKRGAAADVRLDEAQLEARGIDVHVVGRGGQVTYHGPGQVGGFTTHRHAFSLHYTLECMSTCTRHHIPTTHPHLNT